MAVEELKTECYPIGMLPGLSRLFLDFAERREAISPFYPASAYSTEWMTAPVVLPPAHREALADLLEQQNRSFGAGAPALENIARLRNGAGAVVTGQQVTLFGGPLYTILKAATAKTLPFPAGRTCRFFGWLPRTTTWPKRTTSPYLTGTN
jgi:hypothetical protein